jgi:hypothetical protein
MADFDVATETVLAATVQDLEDEIATYVRQREGSFKDVPSGSVQKSQDFTQWYIQHHAFSVRIPTAGVAVCAPDEPNSYGGQQN